MIDEWIVVTFCVLFVFFANRRDRRRHHDVDLSHMVDKTRRRR